MVYYQKGVGSSLDSFQRIPVLSSLIKPDGKEKSPFDGAFGVGLEDNVRAAYGFLAHNYDKNKDDEIYLFGFSRGAYTARSIAGLASSFGLLDKRGMDDIAKVYKAYRDGCFRHDVTDPEKRARGDKLRMKLNPAKPRIKCVGVWDTVGSLGIPNIAILGHDLPFKTWFSDFNKKFQFHDTNLHPNIEFGFQAYLALFELSDDRLALNEERKPFTPAIWNKPPGSQTVLKQVWFPGTHSCVGGSGEHPDLSNIALIWMIQQVHDHTGLAFDKIYLETSKKIRVEPSKPWGCADYKQSDVGVWKLAGTSVRTPNKDAPNSYEKLHRSVETRTNHGSGLFKSWSHPDVKGMDYDDLGELEWGMKSRYPS